MAYESVADSINIARFNERLSHHEKSGADNVRRVVAGRLIGGPYSRLAHGR